MIWFKRISLILLIISIGTVIDYFAHQLDPRFSVPWLYFPHKLFYGTLWGFVGYWVFKKYATTPFWAAFIISATPAVLLQVMYFIKNHLIFWVALLFLFLHFFMFLLPGYYICRKYKEIFCE